MLNEYRYAGYFGLAVLIVLIAFYFPWLTNQQAFYLSDINYYFEPFSRFIGDSLRRGHWPLWNPYSYCGMSQIAIPSPGVFYPPNWIFAFLNYSQGLAWLMVWHQWLAAIGGFLLMRSWRFNLAACWICGLVMGLNGYMFSLQPNYTLVHSIAWLPVALWSVQCFVDDRLRIKVPCLLLAASSVGMLVAAGRPEVSAPSLLLLGVYTCYLALLATLAGDSIFNTLKLFALRCAVMICGLLLAMPVVLPSLEWAALSTRSHGLASGEIFLWSSNWYDFLSLLLNQPLGDLEMLGAKFLSVAAARFNHIPYVASAYVGPIVNTLAIWGLCDRKWPHRWFLTALILAAVLMSLGSFTPVAPWIVKQLPFLAIFRYPEKLLIFVIGLLAVAAAVGMQQLEKGTPDKSGQASACAFWALWILLCAGLLVSAHTPAIAVQIKQSFHEPAMLKVLQQAHELIALSGLKVAALGLTVCVLAQYCLLTESWRKNFSLCIVAGVTTSLLVAACFSSRHGAHADFFNQPSGLKAGLEQWGISEAQRQQAGFRALALFFDPLTYPRKAATSGNGTIDFYQYGRQLLLPNTHMDAGIKSSYGYESAETGAYRGLFRPIYKHSAATRLVGGENRGSDIALWRFCQMTSTGYTYTQVYKLNGKLRDLQLLDPARFELLSENRALNMRIYKVRDTLPRVYFPDKWKVYGSQKDINHAIVNSETTGFDPLACTWLESGDALQHKWLSPYLVAKSRPQLLQIASSQPEKLSVKVNLDRGRLMVVADQHYPGWQAAIDGKPCHIWRANGVLKAVFVPAGIHQIEFTYQPESLRYGLQLAGLGIISLLMITVLATFRQFK